jgi:hypothetical protein
MRFLIEFWPFSFYASFLDTAAVLLLTRRRIMIDPESRHGRELKAAEEFFALARTTHIPFMRSYYQRVAERYLSSNGELRESTRRETSTTRALQ